MKFNDHYKNNLQSLEDRLMLEYTIKDFSKIIPSKRNKEALKHRQKEGKSGSFLKSVTWDEKKDTLHLKFDVVPTPTVVPVTKVTRKGNSVGAKKYQGELLFHKVSKQLGTKKEFLKLTKGTQIKRIRDMYKESELKIHSNDKSYLWQGSWFRASKGGYAIYPIPTKNNVDKGVWELRHGKDQYSTKHLLEITRAVMFIPDEIAKMIRNKYV